MQNDIKAIADHYGYESQSRQLIEEMAELTVAINKDWRVMRTIPKNHESEWQILCDIKENIAEEIADVEIMLEQMKYMLGNHEIVEDMKRHKVARQIKRMKGDNQNG